MKKVVSENAEGYYDFKRDNIQIGTIDDCKHFIEKVVDICFTEESFSLGNFEKNARSIVETDSLTVEEIYCPLMLEGDVFGMLIFELDRKYGYYEFNIRSRSYSLISGLTLNNQIKLQYDLDDREYLLMRTYLLDEVSRINNRNKEKEENEEVMVNERE